MIEQPRRGDGEDAWRRYAGELRRTLGDLKQRIDDVRTVEMRAHTAEARLKGARSRADRWKANFESLLFAKRRDGRILDRIERLLRNGDLPGAIDLMTERRRAIQEAGEQ
ncbi:hypothetical protein GCM10009860_11510 [Microbacterium mitrae]|uniref:Uncharacterized protein n=1 Tax=Microbacterium mitrae TaxID=664640 RepID=A0A5C8HSK5_9MICO|nr:hypothetical protein [Microbacterium mitrae]TXK06467.1 hypothetical protein FVP60_05815 [Microbacterium mitrae]